MNRRGIINSSLAETAGQAAVLQQAVAIGGADAATFGKAASFNADQVDQKRTQERGIASNERVAQLQADTSRYSTDVQASTSRYGTDAQSASSKYGYDTQAATSRYGTDAQAGTSRYTADSNAASNMYSADSQARISAANNASSQEVAKMNNDQQAQANSIREKNTLILNTNAQAASAYNTSLQQINSVNANSNMDTPTKNAAIQQIYANLYLQLDTISRVAGLDVRLDLSSLPGFDANGNPIDTTKPAAASTGGGSSSGSGSSGGSGSSTAPGYAPNAGGAGA